MVSVTCHADMCCASCTCHLEGQKTDGTCPQHHNEVTEANCCSVDSVDSHRQGLHHGALLKVSCLWQSGQRKTLDKLLECSSITFYVYGACVDVRGNRPIVELIATMEMQSHKFEEQWLLYLHIINF